MYTCSSKHYPVRPCLIPSTFPLLALFLEGLHSFYFQMALPSAMDPIPSDTPTPTGDVAPPHDAVDWETTSPPSSPQKQSRSPRFWGTFTALCILSFVCALDVVIITTALPTITAAIGGATQYVWIANSFVVASSVLQPLFGQIADVFGRQLPLIGSTLLFTVGSGIAGGARNPAMLISGRTVQGIGAGGLYVLLDIVCCDLVPLRERGKYVGLMNSFAGLAAALGPPLGGVIAEANWRWIFYLNIPICGVALIAILTFMRMRTGPSNVEEISKSKWKRLDYIGSLLFVPSIIAILLALIMGGIEFSWSSWHIVVPLVLGIAGWASFHIQQAFTSFPMIPTRLFGNRTSVIGFILTFLSSALVQSVSYFLPIYFQAVLGTTVKQSGTYFLPYAIGTLFFAIIGGVLLTHLGKYKALHAFSFAASAVGFGLLTLLHNSTTKVAWVFFEIIISVGLGFSVSIILPAIMAGLPESDVATSTAAYAFIKTFGYVWGVTIPSIIFNAVFNANLSTIRDSLLRAQLVDGAAYAFASEIHQRKHSLNTVVLHEVQQVYTVSLRTIWWVGLGTSLVGFLLVWGERSLELRDSLETEYGLDGTTTEKGSGQ
ncbi:major facilitator superfamily domain-containing protein [Nemania abortiva]|nr:major facilitator superfamily domain-containing protein [Nemania abortiva]